MVVLGEEAAPDVTSASAAAPGDTAEESSGDTVAIVCSVIGVILVIVGIFVARYIIQQKRNSDDDDIVDIDGKKKARTPKKERLSLAMLMNNMTKSADVSLQKGAESFINKDEEGVKVKMTKEELERAENERVEKLKKRYERL